MSNRNKLKPTVRPYPGRVATCRAQAMHLVGSVAMLGLIGVAALLLPRLAHAGLDSAPAASTPGTLAAASTKTSPAEATPSAGAAVTAANDPAVLANRRLAKGRNVLRCWQEGKLIFETAGVQAPAARSADVLDFRPSGSDGAAVQILDLKQGLCTYEAQRP
jgi:hypothetical protein